MKVLNIIASLFLIPGLYLSAQTNSGKSLNIGGYGEVHYNQKLSADKSYNGVLDAHRTVLFVNYNFSSKTHFISEIEFEHVGELDVEQAYLEHRINSYFNIQGGLMLVPMGIINQSHEPTTFNGVERTMIDNKITPTTWREIGIGFQGNLIESSVKYQLYLMNGFSGYNGSAQFSAANGLRKGRQQGAESYISSPNLTGRIQYYGISGLNIGLSGYFGDSQSTLYNGIEKNDLASVAKADSSTIKVNMLGLDYVYQNKGFESRAQLYYSMLGNTDQYNQFASSDLGSSMFGYYIEAGYNVLSGTQSKFGLVPFVRYQAYDTQLTTTGVKNPKNSVNSITTGLTFKLSKGAVVKTDIEFLKSAADSKRSAVLNMGFGVTF